MNEIEKIERTIMKSKTVSATGTTIGVGLITSVSFTIIDTLFFLYIEDHLHEYWEKREFEKNMIHVINSGIATSISIIFAMIIENYLERHFDMFKHPLIDATGVVIGTIIMILLYKVFVIGHKPIIHSFRKFEEEYEKVSTVEKR